MKNNNKLSIDNGYWKLSEISVYLGGISVKTIRKMIKNNVLHAIKIRGLWMVKCDWLDEFENRISSIYSNDTPCWVPPSASQRKVATTKSRNTES